MIFREFKPIRNKVENSEITAHSNISQFLVEWLLSYFCRSPNDNFYQIFF